MTAGVRRSLPPLLLVGAAAAMVLNGTPAQAQDAARGPSKAEAELAPMPGDCAAETALLAVP